MKSLAEEFALAYRRIASPVKYRTAERPDANREKSGQGESGSDASPDESRGQWKTVGGAPAFVGHDGSILAACPGLEDEHVDDITDESDESRDRRERKMDDAEAAGHESNEQKEARGGWQQARDELGDDGGDTLAFLKIGDSYYSFGDDAKAILEATGAGDGESCQIKEGGIQQHLTQLTEAGHRVAIAERDEDGHSEIERTEEPEASDDDGFDFPWETEEGTPVAGETAESEHVTRPVDSVDDAADEPEPDAPANDPVRTPERATKDRPGRVEIQGKAFDVYQDDKSGFWFFQTAGRKDLGWTFASKETRDWLNDQHGSGAMEFPAGSDPRKPTQAERKPADWDARLAALTERRDPDGIEKAPPLADKASPKPPKPPKKLSRFDQAIVDAVGDDPDDVRGFRELALDVYARKQREAIDQNHAYTNLLGQFGVTGAKQGAFIRTIQKLRDPAGIKHFDEMIEMAQRDYPELLEFDSGSHVAGEDAEYALFQRLQRGLVEMPAKWSPEVIDEALDFVAAAERSPVSRLHDNTDWSQVEFSRRRRLFWEAAVKYSQLER